MSAARKVNNSRCRSTFYYEGKRYEVTGKSQKEADQKAAIKLDKLKRGEVGISGNMTVSCWAEEWLETYKRPSVGEGQYKNYKLYVNGVIVPAIGALRLKSVKDVHLQKILNDRQGKSKSDVSRLRMIMKAMFQRAHLSRLISYNPAENLELPAAKDGTHRSITPFERQHILQLAETHHAGLWIKTLLYSGLRPGETRALDWRHIDFKKRLIHVEQAMKAATNEIGAPKSGAGVRDVPIPDKLYATLLAAKKGPFDPVFTQPTTGRRHTQTSMQCLWENFKNELDIVMGAKFGKKEAKDKKMRIAKILSVVAPDLVPYCLRHTYCTDLQDAGVPINVARYLMGHSDISMTAKIYTHTTETAIQEAAKKINAHT
ncbi:MAG: site-specific integrase [Acidobacteriota bacterium]|jgi:integrase|nr:site-specific integrase [Acidobacteriota bacterium]